MDGVSGARSCSNDINACQREDQYAREMLDKVVAQQGNRAASQALTPYGDGYREAKAEGSATRSGVRVGKKAAGFAAHEAAEHSAVHAGEKLAEGAIHRAQGSALARVAQGAQVAGTVVKVASAAYLGYTILKSATEAHAGAVAESREQAQREMDGLNRDAMNAFVIAGAGVFSDEYRAHVLGQMSQDSRAVAMKLFDQALSEPKRFATKRTLMKTQAQAGMNQARALGIDSSKELAKALESNAKLREQYTSGTAFRHGVDSVVFEATRAREAAK